MAGPTSGACPWEYKPACGSDQQTYPNECVLRRANCQRTPAEQVYIIFLGRCDVDHWDLKTVYSNEVVRRLIDYCILDDHMETDRTCMGLPTLCALRPEIDQCSRLGALEDRSRTLLTKLLLTQSSNDPNGDGVTTMQELEDNLLQRFDTNGDGCPSPREWSKRLTTYYSF